MMQGKVERNALKVFKHPEKGNGLKSEVCFKAGDTIISEFPVAFVVCSKQRDKLCASCLGSYDEAQMTGDDITGTASTGLRKCSKCKFIYYCGISCQKKDWVNHKQECKNIVKVQPKRPPDLCLLASRFLYTLARKCRKASDGVENNESSYIKQRILEYRETFSKRNLIISEKRKEMLFTFSVVLQRFIDSNTLETLGILPNDLIGFLSWSTCNCFNILNDDMNSVGAAIYNMACFVNHDCVPNCVAVFETSKVKMQAIRSISSEEELTISYIDSTETRNSRQDELKERYFFQCKCSLCVQETKSENLIEGKCQNMQCVSKVSLSKDNLSAAACRDCGFRDFKDDFTSILERHHSKLNIKLACYNANENERNFDALWQCIKDASTLIPNQSIIMIKCHEPLFDKFVWLQNWENAVDAGLSLLEGYLSHYPEFHPVTGIHLFKLGKIELLIDHLRPGLDHLERAKHILLVTHGKDHKLTMNLLEIVSRLKEEILYTEAHPNCKVKEVKN